MYCAITVAGTLRPPTKRATGISGSLPELGRLSLSPVAQQVFPALG